MTSKTHSALTLCALKDPPPVVENGISKSGPKGVTISRVKYYNHANQRWTWKGLLEDAAALTQSAEKRADMVSLGLDIWKQTPK